MIRILITLLIASGALATTCKSQKEMPKAQDHSPLVEMQMHGCRGYCPVYKLTFLHNTELVYEGMRNMEQMGVVKTGITKEEYDKLVLLMAKANLRQYPEQIKSGVADAPGSTITIYDEKGSHPVSGSIDRPKPILELEEYMKTLAEGHGLHVKHGVDPNAPVESDQQVIVKLKDNVNAGNWIAKYEDYKFKLVRRVSAENMWVVSYNPAQTSEEAIIKLLKKNSDVLDVQANKKATDRN
jgi:hypothetical protein